MAEPLFHTDIDELRAQIAELKQELAQKQELLDRVNNLKESWKKGFLIKQGEFHTARESRARLVRLVRSIDTRSKSE